MNSRPLWLLCPLIAASCSVARAQPSDSPLILGEPVRRQMTPLPATPKTAAMMVAGVDVSGLSGSAALARLKTALAPKLNAPIRLVVGDYQYSYTRGELGASLDYDAMLQIARKNGEAPLRLDVDEKRLTKELRILDEQVKQDFESTALNIGGSAVRVRLALEGDVETHAELITMPWKAPVAPKPDDVATPRASNGKFPYLLASFSTSYNAGLRGRTTNLKMAAKHINGTVIAPGAVFFGQ